MKEKKWKPFVGRGIITGTASTVTPVTDINPNELVRIAIDGIEFIMPFETYRASYRQENEDPAILSKNEFKELTYSYLIQQVDKAGIHSLKLNKNSYFNDPGKDFAEVIDKNTKRKVYVPVKDCKFNQIRFAIIRELRNSHPTSYQNTLERYAALIRSEYQCIKYLQSNEKEPWTQQWSQKWKGLTEWFMRPPKDDSLKQIKDFVWGKRSPKEPSLESIDDKILKKALDNLGLTNENQKSIKDCPANVAFYLNIGGIYLNHPPAHLNESNSIQSAGM